MTLEFENGYACIDFETSQLKVQSICHSWSHRLVSNTKYLTQFSLWADKLLDPSMFIELDLFAEALLFTLDLRAIGAAKRIYPYDEDMLLEIGLPNLIAGDIGQVLT
jgi:hypothetical protein